MAHGTDDGHRLARLGDQQVHRAGGGETHQDGDGAATVLTTQQGVPVSDDQNSLKVGARGPTLLEDFHFREKIFHFDHERIPERVVHARGFGAHGYFENYESLDGHHAGRPLPAGRREDAGLRALLDRRRQQRLGRPRARRPRLRREVLHQARATGTSSATTSRSSSSRTRSSSPTSSTPPSRSRTATSRRRRPPTTISGTSSRSRPRACT